MFMEGFIQFVSDMGTVMNRYGVSLFRGAGMTLLIAITGTLIGCLIGFAVGTVQSIPKKASDSPVKWALMSVLRAVLRAYVEFFRGTPLMLQAMFIFYGSAYVLNLHMSNLPAGIFILSVNTGRLHGGDGQRRHHVHRPRPDRGRQVHRHEPPADHDLRHSASDPA